MKTITSFLAILMAVSFLSVSQAQSTSTPTKETVEVWGNCEMCKARIEKAAKHAGATTADWNVDTKILSVSYAAEKTSVTIIEQKVAAVGHDTKNFTAPASAYNKLDGCCKYDRKTATDVSATTCCANGCTTGDCCKAGGECKDSCHAEGTTKACCKSTAATTMTCTKGAACCASSKKS